MVALGGSSPGWRCAPQIKHQFTAPTERTPSRGLASNDHPVAATMIGGGLGGQQSWLALCATNQTPVHGADGAGALQGIGQQCPYGFRNDDRRRLEGCGPSQPPFAVWRSDFRLLSSVFCLLSSPYSARQSTRGLTIPRLTRSHRSTTGRTGWHRSS